MPTSPKPAKKAAKRTAAKRGPGQPSKCTPARTALICEAIADGLPDGAAARQADVNPGTLSRWKAKADPAHEQHHARYREFREALTRAEDDRLRTLVRDSIKHAALPHEVVKRVEKFGQVMDPTGRLHDVSEVTVTTTTEFDWRAGLELAARYDQVHFGKKAAIEVTGSDGGPIEVKQRDPVTATDAVQAVGALVAAGVISEDATPAEVAAALADLRA